MVYLAPDEKYPKSTCPFVMTGNADERWNEFFVAAWQFGTYASEVDASLLNREGYHPDGVRPFVMEVKVLMSGPSDDLQPAVEDVNGVQKTVVDGITISMDKEARWGVDMFMHYCEMLLKLPCCWPDGELYFTNHPGWIEGAAYGQGCVLNLWHD